MKILKLISHKPPTKSSPRYGRHFRNLTLLWLTTVLGFGGLVFFAGDPEYSNNTFLTILLLIDIALGCLAFLGAGINALLFLGFKLEVSGLLGRSRRVRWLPIVAFSVLSVISIAGLTLWILSLERTSSPYSAEAGSQTQSREEIKGQIFELVNKEREAKGLKSLKESSVLTKSAELKTQDMIEKHYWDHNDPTGKEPWRFFEQAGYEYGEVGENLARDYFDARSVVEGWMASEGHRRNILYPAYREMGIYITYDNSTGYNSMLITQHFGLSVSSGAKGKKTNTSQPSANNSAQKQQAPTTPNTSDSSRAQEDKKLIGNENAALQQEQNRSCVYRAKNEVDQCSQTCKASADYGSDACQYALNALNWDTSRYSECLNENSNIYSNCLNKCNEAYLGQLKSCNP